MSSEGWPYAGWRAAAAVTLTRWSVDSAESRVTPCSQGRRRRGPGRCQARRVALLAWEHLGRPRIEMSTLLGIGSGTAAHLVRRVPQAAERAAALAGHITQQSWALAGSP